MRSPETVVVPNLVGLPAVQAHEQAIAARVVAVDPDPDTPPTVAGTVTAQQPGPGTPVPAGDPVTIWVEPDDGGGGGNMPLVEPDLPLDPGGVVLEPELPVDPGDTVPRREPDLPLDGAGAG